MQSELLAKSLLRPFKNEIEKRLAEVFSSVEEANDLRKACEYALLGGGKRLRPLITMMVAHALDDRFDVRYSSLSVEFFHTASLIADDLPCMDDESLRRDRASLHKLYGESTAILASYTLIALGYEYLYLNAKEMKTKLSENSQKADFLCMLALEKVSKAAGITGATNGQFLDLFPPDQKLNTLEKIISQKTITLFDIAFSLGWLFGGGDPDLLQEVSLCAYHFGMAFQIADDIQDRDEDVGKSNNIALLLGMEEAQEKFFQEMELFTEKLKSLGLMSRPFGALRFLIIESIKKTVLK